jgi:hypothetical protein
MMQSSFGPALHLIGWFAWLAGVFCGGIWVWVISHWFLSLAVVSILKIKQMYLISCLKHEMNERKTHLGPKRRLCRLSPSPFFLPAVLHHSSPHSPPSAHLVAMWVLVLMLSCWRLFFISTHCW